MSPPSLLDLQDGEQANAAGIPRPARRFIRYLIPLALLLTAAAALLTAGRKSLLPTPAVTVEAAVLKTVAGQRPASAVIQATGWLEPYPFGWHVSAQTNGLIREILVLEGDSVVAGQVVARLVDEDAKLALARAEATLALRQADMLAAQAELAAAQEHWDNPIALTRRVATAESALAGNAAALARIQAEIVEQQARLDQKMRNASRAKALADSSVSSTQQAEEASNEVSVSEAILTARQEAYQAESARRAGLQAELLAAREVLRLRTADRLRREQAKAALQRVEAELANSAVRVDEAKLDLARMVIRADKAGVVVDRVREPGEKLMFRADDRNSAMLLHLYDPTQLQVRVDVPLAEAAGIILGQKAEVICEVLPDSTFRGEVVRVLHKADIQKNTLEVKVRVYEPSLELRPAMLCRVRFLAAERTQEDTSVEQKLVFVPAEAVRDGYAWRVHSFDGEFGIATSQPVEAGQRLGDWVAAPELSGGELIVTETDVALVDGQRVQVQRSQRP